MFAVDLAELRLGNDTGSVNNDRYTSDSALVGTVTGSSSASVEFDVDGDGQFDDGSASVVNGTFSFTPLVDDGTYTVAARAKVSDGYGGTFSDTKSLSFTLDRTPPSTTVALLNDTGASSTDGLTNDDRLKGTVDDASLATVRVLVDLDNAGTFAHSATVSSGQWSFDPGLTDGAHTVRVRSVDLAGNSFTTLPLSFQLDTQAPTVTQMTPAHGAELAAAPDKATFTFSEAIDPASITATAIQVLAEAGPKPIQQGSHPTSNVATISFSSTLTPGKYISQVENVLDMAGNTQQSAASATWTVTGPSNSPPTANNDSAQTGAAQAIEIDVLANDSDSDGTLAPSSVTIAIGPNSGSVAVDSSTGKVTYTPSAGFAGVDTFYYTVADDDGAASNQAQVEVTVAAEPPAAPKVKILNANGRGTKDLTVSRWLDAFNGGLKPNFIDSDPDSFMVEVTDPAKAGTGTVVIKLSTDSNDTDYDDDATEIELTEVAGTPGVFRSKSMILVSDNVDDNASSTDADYKIDTPADDAKNDRTHLIALGGKVLVEYAGVAEAATAKVAVEKVVNVHATVLVDANGKPLMSEPYIQKEADFFLDIDGNGAWTEKLTKAQARDRVRHDLRVLNERYAQVGIRFKLSEVSFVHIAGLKNGVVNVTRKSVTGDAALLPDEKALATAGFQSADPNDVEVVYVNAVVRPDGPVAGRAFTSDFYQGINARDFNDIVLLSNQAKYFTQSHEVLHLLTQDKGHPSAGSNLLNDGFTTIVAVESRSHIASPKRIAKPQAAKIFAGAYPQEPGGGGGAQASALKAGVSPSTLSMAAASAPPAAPATTTQPKPVENSLEAAILGQLSENERFDLGIAMLNADDWAELGLKGTL